MLLKTNKRNKNSMKYNHLIAVLAVLSLVLMGCNNQKRLTKTEGNEPKKEAVKPKTIQQRAIEAQPDFQSVNAQKARFQLSYQRKSVAANGTITMIKDSICIISLQPVLGIELFRLELTPADVLIVDKMNRRYVQMSYAEISEAVKMPITFADAQNVLMARMVVLGQSQSVLYSPAATASAADNNSTTVSITEGKINYQYRIDNSSLALLQADYTANGRGGKATVTYSGHNLFGNVLFPTAVNVTYLDSKYDVSCSISLPNLIFNGSVNAARINVRTYKKTTISTILN